MFRNPSLAAALLALAVMLNVGVASAQGVFIGPPPSIVDPQPLTGRRGFLAQELRAFGFGDADVSRMSNQTVALLDNAIHGGGSQSTRRGRVASILNGGGILQRFVDNATGRR